ncbi:Putative adenylate cyclase MJ0240 [Frankliniella fusca]|uniref:Adenylate cyclase MJ0240 n=1 Tax=Frankliniella fusca TaxID=407009 RepID=A0AAE1H4W8_9NEOP|nr:Putative adenylate cyclase MJ0240 [Frankliniella fusca]
MPRNVEIKAAIANFEAFLLKAKHLGDGAAKTFRQVDTFYEVPNGRLKLREQEGQDPQLVFYDRPDKDGPKLSDYECCYLPANTNLKSVLSRAIPVKGVLKKSRTLIMIGQTRVHIDRVEGLGDFMELEVQLSDNETVQDGDNIAKSLMEKLGVAEENLVRGAYMDHILNKEA